MAEQQNKDTIRRIYADVLNQGQLELMDELYADDFTFTGREGTATREDTKNYLRGWREAFSDLEFVIERVIVEGDNASWSDYYSGTNSAAWNGLPATNRRVEAVLSMHEGTFNQDGQLLAHRMVTDEIDERMQLGLLPPTPVLGTEQ